MIQLCIVTSSSKKKKGQWSQETFSSVVSMSTQTSNNTKNSISALTMQCVTIHVKLNVHLACSWKQPRKGGRDTKNRIGIDIDFPIAVGSDEINYYIREHTIFLSP